MSLPEQHDELAALTRDPDIGPEGRTRQVMLSARIASRDGAAVLLPLPGAATEVGDLTLTAQYDAAAGEDWSAELTLNGLRRDGLTLDRLNLRADRRHDNGATQKLAGQVRGQLSGLTLPDPDQQAAIGSDLTLAGDFALPGQGALELTDFSLRAGNARARLDGRLDGLAADWMIWAD